MNVSLYSGSKRLGRLSTVSDWEDALEAIEAFNHLSRGRGRLTTLAKLIEEGECDDPERAASDVSRLLAYNPGLSASTIEILVGFREMALKARGSLRIVKS